jgi:anti-anti-sigma regulatory factor
MIIDISGPIVLGKGLRHLRDVITNVLEVDNINKILLNLEHVTEIDTLSIGELVKLAEVARAAGGDIECFGLCVSDTLILTRVNHSFRVYPDETTAVVRYGFNESPTAVTVASL